MLHTGGGWGETPPPHDCKALWVYSNTQWKSYINASFIHSFINSIVKKAQQRLYFLRQLKKLNLAQAHVTQFYSAQFTIESVLCSSITVWFGSASKSDIRKLQRTVRAAERIIGVPLPSLQDLYKSRVKKRADNVITDPSHPGHNLIALLPSGRCYRSRCTRTSRQCFPPCHLQPKQLTQELLPVFCNSLSIFNYCLSLKYNVNTYAYFSIQLYIE